ncbi:hypothetical protein DWY54_08450 [Parabacteroides distasonis]|nr:hypothetical protein DWY54_08450 [Parabacteroides distasonis]RGZ53313.1 hypothetical protein DW984_22030 [Parabacteroides distasonis]
MGRSGYFSLNLSANSVMRGRLDARRTLKSLVADLRYSFFTLSKLMLFMVHPSGNSLFALPIMIYCLTQFSYRNIPFEIMNTMKRKIKPTEIVCQEMLSSLCKPIIRQIKHNIRLMAKVHEIENSTLSDSAYLKEG